MCLTCLLSVYRPPHDYVPPLHHLLSLSLSPSRLMIWAVLSLQLRPLSASVCFITRPAPPLVGHVYMLMVIFFIHMEGGRGRGGCCHFRPQHIPEVKILKKNVCLKQRFYDTKWHHNSFCQFVFTWCLTASLAGFLFTHENPFLFSGFKQKKKKINQLLQRHKRKSASLRKLRMFFSGLCLSPPSRLAYLLECLHLCQVDRDCQAFSGETEEENIWFKTYLYTCRCGPNPPLVCSHPSLSQR